jgi:DNA-binding transcriptional MocR family regulator
LPEGLRAETVVAELERKGVQVTSADPFATTTHVPPALRVAMGSISLDVLKRALETLREVVDI